jgi:hypothetical protein
VLAGDVGIDQGGFESGDMRLQVCDPARHRARDVCHAWARELAGAFLLPIPQANDAYDYDRG